MFFDDLEVQKCAHAQNRPEIIKALPLNSKILGGLLLRFFFCSVYLKILLETGLESAANAACANDGPQCLILGVFLLS